jgi:hypothetical protein
MTSPFTIECSVNFSTRGRGSRKRPDQDGLAKAARVPRISRLMALAIRFSEMMRSGQVTTYAELAGLGGVTPARMTQIMSLLSLAPDIQEGILFLQQTAKGRDRVQLRHVLPIATIADWRKQRLRWKTTISYSEC